MPLTTLLKPMYGMPQPNTYGQYGFGAYGGFPNQAAGAGNPASPGMPQPGAGAIGTGIGGGQPDPAAAAGAAAGAQAQWPTGDPSSYYSNYWGGEYRRGLFSLQVINSFQGYYGQQAPQQGTENQGA